MTSAPPVSLSLNSLLSLCLLRIIAFFSRRDGRRLSAHIAATSQLTPLSRRGEDVVIKATPEEERMMRGSGDMEGVAMP